jgi:DNA topoisomerase IB
MNQKADTNVDYGKKLAKKARLRYVSDDDAGYTRQRNGSGFRYLNSRGHPLRDNKQLERITGLVIPPAWEQVWICRFGNGHLQATGYDSKQCKQYLYHPRWQEAANLEKFALLGDFGKVRRCWATRKPRRANITFTRVSWKATKRENFRG